MRRLVWGAVVAVPVAGVAAVIVLIFTARGGSRNRPGIAAVGAFFASVIVGLVIDGAQHGYLAWTIIFGIPGGIIGAGLAAAYVAWADTTSRRQASRPAQASSPRVCCDP